MMVRQDSHVSSVGVVSLQSAFDMAYPLCRWLEPGRKLLLPLGLLLGYPVFMAKSIKDTPKKRGRGRPSTGGRREGVMVRLQPAQFEMLDVWIKTHAPDFSRPEAIRRLVELGLKAKASK
jgi:hypothetical protein